MNNRVEYVVIKDFEDKVPFGLDDVTYQYKVGKKIRLRPNGRLAKKWIEKGYIKLS